MTRPSMEEAAEVCVAAQQRSPRGARYGIFTKETSDSHVGLFAWFDRLDDLLAYHAYWLRTYYQDDEPHFAALSEHEEPAHPATQEEIAALLEPLAYGGIQVFWAGPIDDLLTACDGFCDELRGEFMSATDSDAELDEQARLPVAMHAKYWRWVGKYVQA